MYSIFEYDKAGHMRVIKREAVTATKQEDAINLVIFSRAHGISDNDISEELMTKYGYNEVTVESIFRQALEKENKNNWLL